MSDLTPSQQTAIDGLVEQHGGGSKGGREYLEDGTVILKVNVKRWSIGTRGKVEALPDTEELSSSAEAERSGRTATEPEPSAVPASDGEQVDSEAHMALPASVSESAAPTSADLVLSQDPQVYQALTEADERQIMAEIEGRALGAMVYSFNQGGGKVTGLSWKGVQEAVRQMNTRQMGRIKIDGTQPPTYEEITVEVDTGKFDDDGQPRRESKRAVRVTVYGVDEIYGSGRFGVATQLRQEKRKKTDKNGDPIWATDSFADSKALSKAQRNALEGMLPLALVEELKALYLGRGSVEYIDAKSVEITALPPALDDDLAKTLGDEIRSLYAEFKDVHPNGMKAMPPAEFNRYFVAAQHSHDRLEDFKAHMEQRVAEAKEPPEEKAA